MSLQSKCKYMHAKLKANINVRKCIALVVTSIITFELNIIDNLKC